MICELLLHGYCEALTLEGREPYEAVRAALHSQLAATTVVFHLDRDDLESALLDVTDELLARGETIVGHDTELHAGELLDLLPRILAYKDTRPYDWFSRLRECNEYVVPHLRDRKRPDPRAVHLIHPILVEFEPRERRSLPLELGDEARHDDADQIAQARTLENRHQVLTEVEKLRLTIGSGSHLLRIVLNRGHTASLPSAYLRRGPGKEKEQTLRTRPNGRVPASYIIS